MDPEDRPPRPTSVLAGARTHRLARLIGLVLAAFVLVEGLLLGLGLLVTRVLDDSSLPRQEMAFERTVLAERTPLLDQVTRYASDVGATLTVVILTAAGCLLLARRGHGPRLPVFLAVAVAGETALFLLTSLVVDRLRPPVSQLDIAPPTSSFPSGHTAAIIALTWGLALGLARTRPGHRLAALSWFLAVLLPAAVLISRLYRGMHWPTDVAASVVFTLVWLFLLRAILLPRDVPDRRTSGPPGSDLGRGSGER
jgi:membrane-associated phospholipid phosphatase